MKVIMRVIMRVRVRVRVRVMIVIIIIIIIIIPFDKAITILKIDINAIDNNNVELLHSDESEGESDMYKGLSLPVKMFFKSVEQELSTY